MIKGGCYPPFFVLITALGDSVHVVRLGSVAGSFRLDSLDSRFLERKSTLLRLQRIEQMRNPKPHTPTTTGMAM